MSQSARAVQAETPEVVRLQAHIDALEQLLETLEQAVQQQADRLEQANAELAQRNVELRRSNEELELFAYVASHDLQEPLRMIASYTQLLARRYADQIDDDGREFIRYAVDGAVRMQALIEALLEYSRVGTHGNPFEYVALGDVMKTVCEDLQLRIQETGAKLVVDELPTVFADRAQMTHLLENLVANALKFHGDAPPVVHVTAEEQGAFWAISVRDEGIGIDPKYAERIFQIFQRLHTRSAYPGTGIGLALCRRIVERHGGEITVQSKPGAGATFRFTLPRTAD